MNFRRIEEISLNSWPALNQVIYDGWILRFSGGYTKRANSINPVYPGKLDISKKIRSCASRYRARGLRPIFRLASFSPPEGLDRMLADTGYRKRDLTELQFLELDRYGPRGDGGCRITTDTASWLRAFQRFNNLSAAEHRLHGRLIAAVPHPRCLLVVREEGRIVSCGLGVIEGRWCGIFDCVTDPGERRSGYARRLVDGLISWARDAGATRVYLQLVAANDAARALYAGFGFRTLYDYWYRE